MMRSWMMFRPVIGEIFGAWSPENMEVAELDAVLDPIESHVDGARSLLLTDVIGDVVGCQIIGDHHSTWLRVAHFIQECSDVFAILSIME